MNSQEKLTLIKSKRKVTSQTDTDEYRTKRSGFLDWMSINNINPPIKVFEMYKGDDGEVIKSKPEIFQNFNPLHNMRVKTPSETCCEIDKLDEETMYFLIGEICSALIRKQIHFSMWYAVGQRSPHIRIYDFDELKELTEFQRVKAQIIFWRSVVPFGCFHYLDGSMFDDEHFYCLEFSSHWKYGTPFNLVWEYLPDQEEKCNTWI